MIRGHRLLLVVALSVAGCTAATTATVSPVSTQPLGATPTPFSMQVAANEALYRPLRMAVEEDRQHFASTYWSEGNLIVNYVGREADARARVADVIPPTDGVVWKQVLRSTSDLDRIQREAYDVGRTLGPRRVAGTGMLVETNQVQVDSIHEDLELAAKLREVFGDAVVYVVDPLDIPLICDFPNPDPSICPS